MSTRHSDYLWDPRAEPEEEVEQLERLLRPLGAQAHELAERELPIAWRAPAARWRRRTVQFAAVAASLVLSVYSAHFYRLSWREGSPWPMTMQSADGAVRNRELRVGQRIATAEGETATLQAARIGTVTVGPDSAAMLVRTRKGQHRVELERGRLHAKVWAPPSYFGVTHGELRFTDLGCEFDLSVAAGGGTLTVASGWVIYRHRDAEILVPEHYSLAFSATAAQVPMRIDASAELRARVIQLDADAAAGVAPGDIATLAQAIAANARDDDFFTLLNLLVRYPELAGTALYPRLASALHVDVVADHRARWARGDVAAREEWWQRLPAQPKTWWLNWRDMF
jgi:hypothetical protein